MSNKDVELEKRVYFIEGKIDSSIKVLLSNESARRTAHELVINNINAEENRKRELEAENNVEVGRAEIAALRQILSELKDGSFKI